MEERGTMKGEGFHTKSKIDSGCELWPECQNCPLPICKEEIYGDRTIRRTNPEAYQALSSTYEILSLLVGSFPTTQITDDRARDLRCLMRTKELVEMLITTGSTAGKECRHWHYVFTGFFHRRKPQKQRSIHEGDLVKNPQNWPRKCRA